MRFLAFILLTSLLFSFKLSASEAYTEELTLSKFHMDKLKADTPISDVAFDSNGHLWLAGTTALWRWNIAKESLQRMPLEGGQLQALWAEQGIIAAATGTQLFRIQLNPFKVSTHIHPSGNSNGQTGKLSRASQLAWISSAGVTLVSDDGETKFLGGFPHPLPDVKRTWFNEGTKSLWYVSGGNIYSYNFSSNPPKHTLIHAAKHPFINLSGHRDTVMAYTNFTILRLSHAGKIVQIIPINSNRKLLAASINDQNHSYLFNDRLLEIYDTKANKKTQTSIPLPNGASIQAMACNGSHTAIISNGEPLLYKHQVRFDVSQSGEAAATKQATKE